MLMAAVNDQVDRHPRNRLDASFSIAAEMTTQAGTDPLAARIAVEPSRE